MFVVELSIVVFLEEVPLFEALEEQAVADLDVTHDVNVVDQALLGRVC